MTISHFWYIINFQFDAFKTDNIQQQFRSLVSFSLFLFFSGYLFFCSGKALISIKLALSLLVYIPTPLVLCFYIIFILALVLILVHSYYSWTLNNQGVHLAASFKQFVESSHHTIIASAIEQAINSYGEDTGYLCEEILQIIKSHPLSKLIPSVQFNIYLYIVEHSLLTKTESTNTTQVKATNTIQVVATSTTQVTATNTTQAMATNTTQIKAKKNVCQKIHKWFKDL